MDGFMVPLITGVGIVFVAVWVLMAVRSRMKKKQKELEKPPEVVEREMQELIKKAKAEMAQEKRKEGMDVSQRQEINGNMGEMEG